MSTKPVLTRHLLPSIAMSEYGDREEPAEESGFSDGDEQNTGAAPASPTKAPSDAAQDAHDEALLARDSQPADIPIANVLRIMKSSLPSNAKIAKEAKECVQECISEFIAFITSEASEKCMQEKRKTVNGEDVLFAMTSLGFENYGEALKIYLTKYREQTKSHDSTTHQATAATYDEEDEDDDDAKHDNDDGEHQVGQISGGNAAATAQNNARKRKGSVDVEDGARPRPVPVAE